MRALAQAPRSGRRVGPCHAVCLPPVLLLTPEMVDIGVLLVIQAPIGPLKAPER